MASCSRPCALSAAVNSHIMRATRPPCTMNVPITNNGTRMAAPFPLWLLTAHSVGRKKTMGEATERYKRAVAEAQEAVWRSYAWLAQAGAREDLPAPWIYRLSLIASGKPSGSHSRNRLRRAGLDDSRTSSSRGAARTPVGAHGLDVIRKAAFGQMGWLGRARILVPPAGLEPATRGLGIPLWCPQGGAVRRYQIQNRLSLPLGAAHFRTDRRSDRRSKDLLPQPQPQASASHAAADELVLGAPG
jgi:hypothetical protein